MLLLSLQLPIPLAVQLVLLKRMLVIPDQRMALDQGRTKPPMQWFISLHAHVFALAYALATGAPGVYG